MQGTVALEERGQKAESSFPPLSPVGSIPFLVLGTGREKCMPLA